MALGGRVSEEIFFNRMTTGASDDIKKCTQIASGLVTQYGMSDRLGTLNYAVEEGYQKPFSDKTNRIIDEEIRRIIDESYENCKTLLIEKKDLIHKLAEELLAKETLSLPDIVDILG
jgi:AFG3 family protein